MGRFRTILVGLCLWGITPQPVAVAWDRTRHAPAGQTCGASKNRKSTKSSRRWVTHKVVPGERLDQIAARYGVRKSDLIRWNKRLRTKSWIYAGQSLRVYARHVPPPRKRITHKIRRGDTWSGVAKKYGVSLKALKSWNRKVRSFRVGTQLVVYTNPTAGTSGSGTRRGISVGSPTRGRLVNGVQLPRSDDYTIISRKKSWGSSHAISQLQLAVASFRQQTGYSGKIAIGAISKKGGGTFRPHKSHQSGRDIDIRLPRQPGAPTHSDSPDDIDWPMAWALAKAFVETGQVQYIFLDYQYQRRLFEAAHASGASADVIRRAIQYPRPRSSREGVVRHADEHYEHFHVRIRCAPGSRQCRAQ